MSSEQRAPAILAGIDWGSKQHQACAIDAAGNFLAEKSFTHGASGLHEMVGWLLAHSPEGDPEALVVAIELKEGPVVELLLERRIRVFTVNPKQTDRFRDRYSPAGAKDDRRDALVLAHALRTDRHLLHQVEPLAAHDLILREWSRMGEEIQGERARATNRLREQLKRYFLQALDITDDLSEPWFLELILRIHSPEVANENVGNFVASLLRRHRLRRTTAKDVLAALRCPSIVVLPGTAEAASAHVRQLARQLQVLNEQYREIQRELRARLASHDKESTPPGQVEQRDAEILLSLPGFGRTTVATLLGEASEAVRSRDYQRLRKLAGSAPVTEQSGRSRRVHMRRACNGRLRRALTIAASVAIQKDPILRALYDRQRPKDGPRATYGRALRTVTDRLLHLAHACLRDQKTYDPTRRQARSEAA